MQLCQFLHSRDELLLLRQHHGPPRVDAIQPITSVLSGILQQLQNVIINTQLITAQLFDEALQGRHDRSDRGDRSHVGTAFEGVQRAL